MTCPNCNTLCSIIVGPDPLEFIGGDEDGELLTTGVIDGAVSFDLVTNCCAHVVGGRTFKVKGQMSLPSDIDWIESDIQCSMSIAEEFEKGLKSKRYALSFTLLLLLNVDKHTHTACFAERFTIPINLQEESCYDSYENTVPLAKPVETDGISPLEGKD